MVLGIGVDITEIERVARSIEKFGDRFLGHIFTPEEIAYCRRKRRTATQSFAARFAAKEAAAKALGTGIGAGVTWKQIEVRREPEGRPTLHLTGRAAERALEMGVRSIALSLTHTGALAFAQVLMEG